MGEEFEYQRRTYLIGDVCHADIKEWKFYSHHISRNEGEFMLVFWILKSFGEFWDHSRIYFDCNNFFGSLKKECCQISCAGADFEDDVCGSDGRFLNHLVEDVGVDEDVLAIGLVEDHASPAHSFFLNHDCWYWLYLCPNILNHLRHKLSSAVRLKKKLVYGFNFLYLSFPILISFWFFQFFEDTNITNVYIKAQGSEKGSSLPINILEVYRLIQF